MQYGRNNISLLTISIAVYEEPGYIWTEMFVVTYVLYLRMYSNNRKITIVYLCSETAIHAVLVCQVAEYRTTIYTEREECLV